MRNTNVSKARELLRGWLIDGKIVLTPNAEHTAVVGRLEFAGLENQFLNAAGLRRKVGTRPRKPRNEPTSHVTVVAGARTRVIARSSCPFQSMAYARIGDQQYLMSAATGTLCLQIISTFQGIVGAAGNAVPIGLRDFETENPSPALSYAPPGTSGDDLSGQLRPLGL